MNDITESHWFKQLAESLKKQLDQPLMESQPTKEQLLDAASVFEKLSPNVTVVDATVGKDNANVTIKIDVEA